MRKLADDLLYDSHHKLEEAKRQQAKMELMKIETELKNREGIRGVIRQVKKLLKSNG